MTTALRNRTHCNRTGAARRLPRTDRIDRTAHLVDIENLLGPVHRTALNIEVHDVLHRCLRATGARAHDLIFAGCHPRLAFAVEDALPGRCVRVRHGKDGGERAVLDAVEAWHLESRVDRVCIWSGDHEFAPLAERLRQAGIRVLVVARAGTIANVLRRHADEVLELESC